MEAYLDNSATTMAYPEVGELVYKVIVPAPYWVSYPEMVKLAEGKPVIVTAGIDQKWKITTAGSYLITLNQLEETISIVKQ